MKHGAICYIEHSLPVTHAYYSDHMNAHIYSERCEKHEARKRRRRERAARRRDNQAKARGSKP